MHTGTVYLVGAGPGDPDLLTVKARRRIAEADVVLHDSLVGPGIVELAPDRATVENVGKRPNGERTSQDEINRRMVTEAKDGKRVVRLKGGDPNVFGRGGEESEFLALHDVPIEIVPGVTSVVAAPGVAGIPLTHRDRASSVTVITGHEDPTKESSALDWDALARTVTAGGTLVILMGVGRLHDNVRALAENGVAQETPVAMIEKATLPAEYAITGTLDDIVANARNSGVEPPAVTVVGDVVAVGDAVHAHLGATSASQRHGSGSIADSVEGEVNH